AAVTFAAMFRLNEQIFEIETRSTKPGGKVMKEDRKPDGGCVFKREQNFRGRFLAEQNFRETFFSRDRADQFKNDWNVALGGRSNFETVRFHRETGLSL